MAKNIATVQELLQINGKIEQLISQFHTLKNTVLSDYESKKINQILTEIENNFSEIAAYSNDNVEINHKCSLTISQLEKASGQINSLKNTLVSGDNIKYTDQFSKTICSFENTVLRLRDTANRSCKVNARPVYYKNIINKLSDEIYKIEIKSTDNIVHLTLPNTLPHYQDISKTIFIEPLNNSLKRFCAENKLKFSKAVFVIINHISVNQNERFIRDNDNYEYKQLVNCLAYWFLNDDNYKCCNMYNTTKISDENFTEIYVVPSEKFPTFIAEKSDDVI